MLYAQKWGMERGLLLLLASVSFSAYQIAGLQCQGQIQYT